MNRLRVSNKELTDEEVLALAEKAGTFDFLYYDGEDIYIINEGKQIK